METFHAHLGHQMASKDFAHTIFPFKGFVFCTTRDVVKDSNHLLFKGLITQAHYWENIFFKSLPFL